MVHPTRNVRSANGSSTSNPANRATTTARRVTIVRPENLVSPKWMEQGSCRGYSPDTFFPSDGVGVIRTQRICAACPVRAECLEYALVNHIEHGVWGGTSERERLRIRRARARNEPTVRAS